MPTAPTDFVDGLVTMAGNGDPAAMSGCAIHLYAANRSMTDRFFYDADGELLIVPQQGRLRLATEFGRLDVEPQEIAVIPRGVRFRVELPDGAARGYVCENYGAPFRLPDLGVDRLQRPRQSARLPDAGRVVRGPRRATSSSSRSSWATCGRRAIDHSPLDVVAWHGNYAPYKYDLRALQRDRLDQLRPSRSVDLPRAAVAERHAGRGHDRLRDLPAAHPRDGAHVPAAVVPPQRRERVHGADPRRLRRQGRRLRARRREPAQLHDRPRPGRRDLREGEHGGPRRSRRASATRWRSCSRRALSIRPTRVALESAQLQPEYFRCWQGLKKHFDPTRA